MVTITMKLCIVDATRKHIIPPSVNSIFLQMSSLSPSMLIFLDIFIHFPFNLILVTAAVFADSTSVPNVKSYNFLKGVGTQKSNIMQKPKEGSHSGQYPSNQKQHANNLAREQCGIRGPSSPTVKPAHMVVLPIHQLHQAWLCKESYTQGTPDTVDHVNRNCIDSIINFHLHQKFGSAQIQRSSDQSNDNTCPTFNDRTSCSNCYQSAQASIHCILQIVMNFSGIMFGDNGR
mmetsp:Transcript_8673/g.15082  ORF Transcript_8673/g.15082 Transcript_8673/m.15082 type:complete len:232 (-) Transcript_8673:1161-1856(-)